MVKDAVNPKTTIREVKKTANKLLEEFLIKNKIIINIPPVTQQTKQLASGGLINIIEKPVITATYQENER